MLPQAGQLPQTAGTLYTVPRKFSSTIEWLQVVVSETGTLQFWVTVRGVQVALTAAMYVKPGLVNVLEGVPLRLDSEASIQGVGSTTYGFLISGQETRNEGN